ncbi:DNA internalization-related competence protein ComEC/Rec2 [Desulfurivibrio alkaliphilus]|uniref:DNA internalization-related competence protein ComEC/Rec2 n=1 Tax=Desulfurivibrio alkaliphilus (strain DSM 19089 / UNIQEM U267 / AHT2) TaxID=589865 RepID=D6Z2J0_DESAT|nr:DNA internalization-related competence protein ComEC/Rec2 [Desulfurivibrio alkaliphilus]ADH85765.1 DNA internalization-related competence protein ComEC/Rec2 [Desulfurivibrio alkaliphilus AHT 2]
MAAPDPAGTHLHGRLILPALAFAAGIAAAHRLGLPPAAVALPSLAGLLLLLGGLLLRKGMLAWKPALPRPLPLFSGLLLLIFFTAGHQLAQPQLTLPTDPDHLYNLLPAQEQRDPAHLTADLSHDVVLVGVLQELPRQSGPRTRLVVAAEELHRPEATLPARGLVQLTLNGHPEQEIRPGERLLVRTRLGPVRAFTVPGAFDYRQFLAHRGIHLSGWVADPLQLAPVKEIAPEKLGHRLAYLPERLRTGAGQRLEHYLAGEDNLPVLRALLIGDRSGIAADTLEAFKAGGAMHLLAISGMHLGLIALLSMAALEWLLKRSPYLLQALHVRKAALLLALLPIVGYALITGLQPPAQRALIMTLVFIGAVLCNRQWCSLNNLALAGLIILALDPPALFGASFQLSFAATAGIIMLVPSLQDRYREATTPGRRLLFWVITSLLVSAVATLVTAPLAMHHFHRVSLLSPLTTLLATPLIFFWTLPLALIGLALSTFGQAGVLGWLAGILLTAASRGLDLTVTMTVWLAELPGSFFYFAPPSVAEFAAWGILLTTLALLRRHLLFPVTAATMVLLLLLLPVYHQWQRQQDTGSRVSFIEVGHGNATVVEMPGNRIILVDGGGPATLTTNVGEQLIAPFLRRQRIRRLESVVISHPHADHYNGIPFLLRHFRPQTLWVNGHTEGRRDYDALLKLAGELGVEIRVPEAGEILAAGENFSLINLSDFHRRPAATFEPPLEDRVNDQSLIISYRHQKFSLLLPGDISKGQERRLLAEMAAENPKTGHLLLAASHHGRATSMAPEFIAAVNPAFIAVSDDQRRTDYQRVAKWQQTGTTVLTTGRHGTITCDNRQEPVCAPALKR